MRYLSSFAAVGLCLALGACGDEPSEAGMHRATSDFLTRSYQTRLAAMNLMMGAPRDGRIPPPPTVTAFRKIGCVPAQPAAGHTCEFDVGINGVPAQRDKGRFVTAADGTVAWAQ